MLKRLKTRGRDFVVNCSTIGNAEGIEDSMSRLFNRGNQLTAAGNCGLDECVQLLIASNGEMQMSWSDALDFEIL